MASPQESDIRDYVLGRIAGPEAERAEERFIGDAELFEKVMAEEEYLIQEYAAGRLSGRDRTDFERQCALREDLRDRIALERELPGALRGLPPAVAAPAAERRRIYRLALPVAAVVAVAMMGAAAFLSFQLHEQSRLAAAREQAWQMRDAEQKDRIARLKKGTAPAEGPLLALLISPSTRAGAAPSFTVPPVVDWVELRFNIGGDTNFASYRVTIRSNGLVIATTTAEGQVIEGRRVVSALIPAVFSGRRVFDAMVAGARPGETVDVPVEAYSFVLNRGR